MGRSRRTLPEELLLLALDPTTGTTAQPQSLDLGLAGAQLVELALAGRIAPDGDRIAVVMPRPTGDPTLDSALELLRRRGSPVRAVHWIGGPRLGLRQIYLSHLERCGMVHAVAGQMCGVLPTTRYQATETAISRDIRPGWTVRSAPVYRRTRGPRRSLRWPTRSDSASTCTPGTKGVPRGPVCGISSGTTPWADSWRTP